MESCKELEICASCENCFTCEKVGNLGQDGGEICVSCENCFTCEKVGQPHGINQCNRQQRKPAYFTCNSFTVFGSEGCNLDCKYCFFRGQHDKKNMSIEVGLKVVELLFLVSDRNAPTSLWFFGGEPLLNYEVIKQMVGRGKELAKKSSRVFNFGATTNGTLIDEDMYNWWKENNGNFLFSIDGCEEAHDLNRIHLDGSGSFQEAWQWVSRWLKEKPDTSIRYTVNPSILDYQIKGLQYLVDNGAINIAMCPDQECLWTEENYQQYKKNLFEIAEIYLDNKRQGRTLNIKPFTDGFSLHKTKGRMSGSRCGTGSGDVGVGIDGKLYLCHRFVLRDLESIGDVDNGFNENRPLNYNLDKIQGFNCDKCHIKARCNGWCIAVNYDKEGDIYKVPEVVCKLEYIHQEVADYILHRERNIL